MHARKSQVTSFTGNLSASTVLNGYSGWPQFFHEVPYGFQAITAAMAATGVGAIMVGRAALARPWIFGELKAALDGQAGESGIGDPFETHLKYILEFRRQLAERYPGDHIPSEDAFASVKMHTHLFRYFSGRPGAAALRARLNTVRTLADIRSALADMVEKT